MTPQTSKEKGTPDTRYKKLWGVSGLLAELWGVLRDLNLWSGFVVVLRFAQYDVKWQISALLQLNIYVLSLR